MTTTQTDRELDARVSVEVMGWSDAPIALGTPGHPVAVWRDRRGLLQYMVHDWRPTEDARQDVMVLEHIRETWGFNARWRFSRALKNLWHGRAEGTPPIMRYRVGDYARAALAALDAEREG